MEGDDRIKASIALGRLRGAILEALSGGDFSAMRLLLPQYATKLEELLLARPMDAAELHRMQTEHDTFFEQLKVSLSTSRIQLRLELERVKASRSYSPEAKRHEGVVVHG